ISQHVEVGTRNSATQAQYHTFCCNDTVDSAGHGCSPSSSTATDAMSAADRERANRAPADSPREIPLNERVRLRAVSESGESDESWESGESGERFDAQIGGQGSRRGDVQPNLNRLLSILRSLIR